MIRLPRSGSGYVGDEQPPCSVVPNQPQCQQAVSPEDRGLVGLAAVAAAVVVGSLIWLAANKE